MHLYILSPLVDFANLIGVYFAEMWDFLIFIGNISLSVVVLAGAILWFADVNTKRGKGLVLGGILLAITVQYFAFFSPSFSIA